VYNDRIIMSALVLYTCKRCWQAKLEGCDVYKFHWDVSKQLRIFNFSENFNLQTCLMRSTYEYEMR